MLDAFDTPYMQRALVAGLLCAVPLGLIGVFVVLRGLAFFSHAVGVATFPGVVVGLGVPALGPFAGSLAAAAVFTGGVAVAGSDRRLAGAGQGAVTGLALSTAMAVGAVLLVSVYRVSTPVERVLFGSLLGIDTADVMRCAAVAVAVPVVGALAYRRLAAATFDRAWAAAAGARPAAGDVVLLALLGLSVVAALPAVGSLMVSGLVVTPAATVHRLARRLPTLLAGTVGLCAAEVVAGLIVARRLDVPPGASIAATGGAVFAAVLLAAAARDAVTARRLATTPRTA